jgi:Zn-dependent protease/predicted transcriptional regulator
MKSGFSIGRVFGINIRIDWSWLLIFALITWNLATVFAQVHPGWNLWLAWLTALVAALLFFGSVLAHELAHSLVARARGIPVRSITLFLFGGVSNIQREPPSPLAEFLITIVGPITSVVLGLVFIWMSGVAIGPLGTAVNQPTDLIASLDPVTTLLLWLGPINILVGVFNLIPGFPLDGGRVLRSILWAIMHNLRRATRWATIVGQVVAWLMIFAGIAMVFGATLPFFGTGLINGLWLAFIGWFLNNASVQSYQQVLIQDILEGVPVSRMMRTNPTAVPATISVGTLVQDYIMGTDDHSFPVMSGSQLVGLVTLEDVRKTSREKWETTTVKQIMTTTDKIVEVTPDEDAAEAMRELAQRDVRQLPVVDHGELVGVLRRRDIVRWLQLHSEAGLS